MDNIVEVVNKLLKQCKPSEIEIEARIRKQLVGNELHSSLLSCLGGTWSTEEYKERRRIAKSNRKCAYRQRTSASGSTTICKSSIAREELNDAWCTLNVSIETPIPSMSSALQGVEEVSVIRHRIAVEDHYVDVVHDDSQGSRVEIEVHRADEFDPESTVRVVERVCTLLQKSRYFVGYYDWCTVLHVAATRFGPFCVDSGDYQRPRTMTMESLSAVAARTGDWMVTPKVDGERRFIIAINSRVYSVGLAKDVRLEGNTDYGGEGDSTMVSVIDCEYTDDNVYHVFDTVVVDGVYVGDSDMLERLEMADGLRTRMSDDLRGRVVVKAHHGFNSFDRLCELYTGFCNNKAYAIDGIIFVDTTKGYMQHVAKWKPHSTVDLMVTNEGALRTYDGWFVNVPLGPLLLPMPSMVSQVAEQTPLIPGIWEFRYDNKNNLLLPMRPRPDKPQANSKAIVETNMMYAVPGSLFSGVGCYMMRKHHNRVKRDLIAWARVGNAVILDIGTGQGGDVGKWKNAAMVYCIEPSCASTREMVNRHHRMKNVNVINVHLRDLDHSMITKRVDVFTAFFCMNQFDDADWAALKRLVSCKGSSGCRLLAIAMTSPRMHKGGCFDITMKGDDGYNIKIHGTRIQDIDERVVNPDALTRAMGECGLKQVKRARLNDDDFMTEEERVLSSMYEAFAYKRAV
jgi:hypothetical protein